jgi:hypothetical protein
VEKYLRSAFRGAEIKLDFMQISVAGGSGFVVVGVFATVDTHERDE